MGRSFNSGIYTWSQPYAEPDEISKGKNKGRIEQKRRRIIMEPLCSLTFRSQVEEEKRTKGANKRKSSQRSNRKSEKV